MYTDAVYIEIRKLPTKKWEFFSALENKGFRHIGCRLNPLSSVTPQNVIEEAQIRLKKSRCFSIMEPWQKRESDGMSAIHEKGGRCH